VNYLPILIDIRNQDVLVVGGGHVAARKARGALRAGARVTVLGDTDDAAMAALSDDPNCRRISESFSAEKLKGVRLVFAATDDEDLAHSVSRAAREAGIPVNVADKTALCSFIMPATVDRHPMVVAVSSGGDAPILTRSLRAHLETLLPSELGRLAEFVADRRDRVTAAFPDFEARRKFWDRFMDGPIPELLSDNDEAGAERAFEIALGAAEAESRTGKAGSVAIVGCGPGDPDLLTIKALRLMQQADVAAVNADVPAAVAERVRRDAEQIDIGPGDILFGLPGAIDARVEQWIGEGKSVVRLGLGDYPSSEQGLKEAAALAERNIRPMVVGGVAAAAKG